MRGSTVALRLEKLRDSGRNSIYNDTGLCMATLSVVAGGLGHLDDVVVVRLFVLFLFLFS